MLPQDIAKLIGNIVKTKFGNTQNGKSPFDIKHFWGGLDSLDRVGVELELENALKMPIGELDYNLSIEDLSEKIYKKIQK